MVEIIYTVTRITILEYTSRRDKKETKLDETKRDKKSEEMSGDGERENKGEVGNEK